MTTHDGGKPNVKPIPYSKPQGPANQMRQGPGLGGTNYGNGQKHECYPGSGSPGIGGDRHPKGSQDDPQY